MGTLKIHPSIGVARVGDSAEYYLSPDVGGGLPSMPDGRALGPSDFRDGVGRIRRQAALFHLYCYDERNPEGVELIPGHGGVKEIRWTVHLANKKAAWYQFLTLLGETGYSSNHPLRNPTVCGSDRLQLMIDPGPRTISGYDQLVGITRTDDTDGYPAIWPPTSLEPRPIDSLGELRTDCAGRLVVTGGPGHSGTTMKQPAITHYANNDDWWDDTSDGPVTASVCFDDGRVETVDLPAWVVVGPPKYAPQLVNLVTMWDTMFDTAVRHMGARPEMFQNEMWNRDYVADWKTEIEPILRRGMNYPWASAIPPHAHSFNLGKLAEPNPAYQSLRQFILKILRPPTGADVLIGPSPGALDQVNAAPGLTMMPWLAGDNCFFFGAPTSKFLKLSDTQYFLLEQWAAGQFVTDDGRKETAGAALDRAALENCVGGGFSPGMEITWISRNPQLFMEPFRIKHKRHTPLPLSLGINFSEGMEPGDVCKFMALPWQADYNECSAEQIQVQMGPASTDLATRVMWWWPAQRPSAVWVGKPGGQRHQVAWIGSLDDQNAPDYVQFADDLQMVTAWTELAFLYNYGSVEKPEILAVLEGGAKVGLALTRQTDSDEEPSTGPVTTPE